MHRAVTLLHPSSNLNAWPRHAMICLKSSLSSKSEDRAMPTAYVPARRKLKQSAQGRLLSSASRACRELVALSAFSRLPRAYPGFGNRAFRLIGVGAGVGQKWIAITSTATAGGHRLALLQCLKAAGAHSGSDVLAAILAWARRRRRRHRKIGQRE